MFLGRAHWRHGLRVPLEEHVLVMAPPRTFKTAFLADVILRYPGPVIATTTKADVFALTAAVRARRGPGARVQPAVHRRRPVHLLLVAGRRLRGPGDRDPAGGRVRVRGLPRGRRGRHLLVGQGQRLPARLLPRRRPGRRTTCGPSPPGCPAPTRDVPERILAAAGARQWALTLAELRSEAHKTAATVRMVMSRAISFMADPALAASVLPAPGRGVRHPRVPALAAGPST